MQRGMAGHLKAQFKVPPSLPTWFKLMAQDGRMNSLDTARLFGWSKGMLLQHVQAGEFPPPDSQHHGVSAMNLFMAASGATFFKRPAYFWRKSTILAEIKRRKDAAVRFELSQQRVYTGPDSGSDV